MKKLSALIGIFFLLTSVSVNLCANDSSGAILPTGDVQLKKTDGIIMEVESLYMKPERMGASVHGIVEVNYIFKNITDEDIVTEVFFPLPEMATGFDDEEGLEGIYQYFHDFNFKLYVNGKEKEYNTHFEIFSGTYNVTNILKPLYKSYYDAPKGEYYKEHLKTLSEDDRQYLENSYEQNKERFFLKKKVYFYWQQIFPANKRVHIKHIYTAQEYDTALSSKLPEYVKNYSTLSEYEVHANNDPALMEKFDKYVRDYHSWYHGFFEYILTTANNWNRPIRSFNLLVEGISGANISFEGNPYFSLDRYNAKNILNFSPSAELYVEFGMKVGSSSKNLFNEQAKQDEYIAAVDKYDTEKMTELSKEIKFSNAKLYKIDGPANVRDNPNGKKNGQIKDGEYVWVVESVKDWRKIVQNDLRGWMHKQNLIDIWAVEE